MKSRQIRPHRDKQILSLWLGKYKQHHLLPPQSVKATWRCDTHPSSRMEQLYFHHDLPPLQRKLEELQLDLGRKEKEKKMEEVSTGESSPVLILTAFQAWAMIRKIETHCLQGCSRTWQDRLLWAGCHSLPLSFQIKNHLWDYFRRTAGLFMDSIYFLSGSSLDLNFSLFLFSAHLGTDRFSPPWTRRSKHLK